MLLNKAYLFISLHFFILGIAPAQQLIGILHNAAGPKQIENAVINEINSNQLVYSNSKGEFSLEASKCDSILKIRITAKDFEPFEIELNKSDWNPALQEFHLFPISVWQENNLELSPNSGSEDSEDSDVYSLLSSANDPILEAASFQFSLFRTRLKGVEQNYDQLGLNGFLLNDPVTNRIPYHLISGQNLLTKYGENYRNYKDNSFDFGSSGLSQWVEASPEAFRKELFIRYANSNRAYNHKLDVHFASGELKHGWSILAGVNRRWAQEAFIPGSFYDAWGSYFGCTKRITTKHFLHFLFMDASILRGKASPATKEVYELAGDNYYNSYWGFQEGQKRNSREVHSVTPMAMINYNWHINRNLRLTSGILFLKGERSDTRLDWYNAPDPRPDYYQKLPSYIEDSLVAQSVEFAWKNNINIRQINWNQLYQSNYVNLQTIVGINGNPNDSITGKRAVYWLEEKHYDPSEIEHFGKLNWIKKNHEISGCYRMEWSKSNNYLKVNDLLGADFLVDLEDFATLPDQQHPDIRFKNHIIKKSGVYGYNYDVNNQNYTFDGNYIYTGKHVDLSFGAEFKLNSFFRTGKFQNAIFANSLGKSEKISQRGFGFKTMGTYKITGRNYLRLNVAFQKLPNRFDQVFVGPEWRSLPLNVTDQTKVNYFDFSYFYRSPNIKFEISPYFVRYTDQIINENFFLDEQLETAANSELADGGLISAFYTGLDQQHVGIESSLELNLGKGFLLTAVYTIGDHIYTSRPDFLIYDKFSVTNTKHVIYLKNFYVPGSALQAASLSLNYNIIKDGFAVLTANYVSDQYLEANPLRRIPEAVSELDPTSIQFHKIIDQEKLPSAFYINFFAYKRFKVMKQNFAISVSVNNIFNTKSVISGGFEQFRFDYKDKNPDKFPSKYYFLQGFNYYAGLSWRYDL